MLPLNTVQRHLTFNVKALHNVSWLFNNIQNKTCHISKLQLKQAEIVQSYSRNIFLFLNCKIQTANLLAVCILLFLCVWGGRGALSPPHPAQAAGYNWNTCGDNMAHYTWIVNFVCWDRSIQRYQYSKMYNIAPVEMFIGHLCQHLVQKLLIAFLSLPFKSIQLW